MPVIIPNDVEVLLDPGHGGSDPGAVKLGREEDWTLKISLYQYERFKELGIPVGITRNSDEDLPEDKRVSLVKNSGAKYCYSNHLNAGGGDRAEVIHSIYDDGSTANLIKEELLAVGQTSVKVYSKKGTSGDYYYMHRRTGAVKVNIVEYAFIDNQADYDHFVANWEAYAEATVKAHCRKTGRTYAAKKSSVNNGWIKGPSHWNYYENGELKKGWLQDGGKWYFLDQNGNMVTGWIKVHDKWYFMDTSGAMQTGWLQHLGKWYYLNPDGDMATGVIKDGDKMYFLHADGSMAVNERVNVSVNVGADGSIQI